MPKPDKHFFVCTQARPSGHPRGSCGERDAKNLWESFINEIEQRQLFDKVGLTNTGCLGPCGTGANVLVYPDGVMYGNVTVSDVGELIESHILEDEPLERLKLPSEIWG